MKLRHTMLALGLVASLGGCATTGGATAAAPSAFATPEAAVNEHIRALKAKEIAAVVDGYSEDAVLIVSPKPFIGKPAIRALFEALPMDDAQPEVTVDSVTCTGEWCLAIYHTKGMRGGDTFTVRDGKIVMQSVFIAKD